MTSLIFFMTKATWKHINEEASDFSEYESLRSLTIDNNYDLLILMSAVIHR